MSVVLDKIIGWLLKNWKRPWFPIPILAIIELWPQARPAILDVLESKTRAVLYVSVALLWPCAHFLALFFRHSKTSFRTDNARVVIAYRFGAETAAPRIREDFVQPLKRQLARVQRIEVLDYTPHLDPTFDHADIEDVARLRAQVDATIALSFFVKDRPTRSGDEHFLSVLVCTHTPWKDPQNKSNLQKQLAELFPPESHFPTIEGVYEFPRRSASYSSFVCYVAGICCFVRGQIPEAEALYRSAEDIAAKEPSAARALSTHIANRLQEIAGTRALMEIRSWLRSGDKRHGEAIGKILTAAGWSDHTSSILRATAIFISSRNTARAIATLGKRDVNRNPQWLLSLAFLEAYQGDAKRAQALYSEAAKKPPPPSEAITNAEAFIDRVIKDEQRHDLLFLLGMLNLYFKSDKAAARSAFNEYILKCPQGKAIAASQHYLSRLQE